MPNTGQIRWSLVHIIVQCTKNGFNIVDIIHDNNKNKKRTKRQFVVTKHIFGLNVVISMRDKQFKDPHHIFKWQPKWLKRWDNKTDPTNSIKKPVKRFVKSFPLFYWILETADINYNWEQRNATNRTPNQVEDLRNCFCCWFCFMLWAKWVKRKCECKMHSIDRLDSCWNSLVFGGSVHVYLMHTDLFIYLTLDLVNSSNLAVYSANTAHAYKMLASLTIVE